MKKTVVLLLSLAVLFLVKWRAEAEDQPPYLVVANQENPISSLSKGELSRILLKKTSKWSDGRRAEPVDQSLQDEVRSAFTKDVHGRSISGIKHYWQRQVFTGGNIPPPEVTGDSEVVDYIKDHPGGIGYVSQGASVAGVKVLTITE